MVEAGTTPGRNPLLAPLGDELARRGVELAVWDPTGAVLLPPEAPAADLYLLKADDPVALAAAACLHDEGAQCLNSYPSTAAAHDKPRTLARLARQGIAVPETVVVGDRAALEDALAGGPRFVKPVRGAHGLGAQKLGPGDAGRAGPGPWLVQAVVGDGSSEVLKVYGVDGRAAVRRMRFEAGVVDGRRDLVRSPDPQVLETAPVAAAAAGLVCYGADFVVGEDGPVLVDLNPFPGYRTVPEAPVWLADAIEEALA